jgi:hypothetical protein
MKKIFNRLKEGWLFLSRILGRVSTMILLTVIYVLVIGPMALVVKIFQKDLLQRKFNPEKKSYWRDRVSEAPTIERNTFQF